jgi:hypothetical protein
VHLDRYAEAANAFDASVAGARVAGNQLFATGGVVRAVRALVAGGHVDEAQARLAALPGVNDEVERGSRAGVRYLLAQASIALASGAPTEADRLADKAHGLSAKSSNVPLQRDAAMVAARAALAGGDPARPWIARSLRCSGRGPRHSTRARRRPSARRCCCKHRRMRSG